MKVNTRSLTTYCNSHRRVNKQEVGPFIVSPVKKGTRRGGQVYELDLEPKEKYKVKKII